MARELSQQLQNRTMEKTYLALVRGGRKTFPCNSGRINASIQYIDGRATLDLLQDCKPSITEWELVDSSVSGDVIRQVPYSSLLKSTVPISLLRFKLHTGDKHQLRVHAAHYLKGGSNVHFCGMEIY